MLLNYLKKKLARKKARRQFSEYPWQVDQFELPNEGNVQFANWQNPLVPLKKMTQTEVDFFKRFIPKGSLAIDIGGNTGDTTVPMGIAAGKEGFVIGFDPNPHVFQILQANAGLNKDKTNIIALPYAIAEKESEFYYGSSEASYSNGGIMAEANNYHGSFVLPQKVKGINLKDFLEKEYPTWLPKLAFIKIDTEGYDKEIIKSIAALIRQYKPVLASECFTKLSKEERYDLYDTIAGLGYDLFYFLEFEQAIPLMPITRADMTKWKHFNILATPKKG